MPQEIWERQRQAMAERGWDALAIISPENVAWTSGVAVPSQKIVRHRHAICVVPVQGDPEMIVVNIEDDYVKANADIAKVTAYNEFTQKPVLLLADVLKARGLAKGRIGVEVTYLNQADYALLVGALPGARLEPADALLDELRMIKTADEIKRLRHGARIAERVGYEALRTWRPGMTELDLARSITDLYGAHGGDKLTMLSVTAGERSAMLNGTATPREIKRGEVVRIDVIGTVANYYCDVARTATVGTPAKEVAEIWTKLRACRDMAVEMIRPGASSHAIFKAYIEKMDAWGLPTLHFLGHGLGLTLHEEPYLNRYKDCILQEGMVLAIEPLVVFPQMGLQLEEAVLVTRDGCEVFTEQYDTRHIWQMEGD